jgi:hypothetical protein
LQQKREELVRQFELLTHLRAGQRASVLQLPARAKTPGRGQKLKGALLTSTDTKISGARV